MLAPFEGEITGASHLNNPVWFDQVEEGLDFVGVAGHFDVHALRSHVDDLGAEDVTHLHDFRALAGRSIHFEHDEFALSGLTAGKIRDFKNIDQFIHLLDRLVKVVAVAKNRHRNPGEFFVDHRAHVQRLDIEATTAEHSSDAGENSELIFDED